MPPAVTRVRLRETPTPADPGRVGALVAATGFFSPEEQRMAEDLVAVRVADGPDSGYGFFFSDAPAGGQSFRDLLGYACYGPTPCAAGTWDLYWIATHPRVRGTGLGHTLFEAVERTARRAGGRLLVVETSSRAMYEPTRRFYLRQGCLSAAVVPDFYAEGDSKVIYTKRLERTSRP